MKKFTKLVGLCLASFLLLSTLPNQLHAQNFAKRIIASNGDSVPFLQYLPAGHNLPGNTRKYPLIIFLHGGGERSDNASITAGNPVWNLQGSGTSAGAFNGFGPSRLARLGNKMNFTWNGQVDTFIVLSPMSRLTKRTAPNAGTQITAWPLEYIDGIIKYATDSLKVDTNRIYLTGLSYGGGGTFEYLNSSSVSVRKLAAAAPICAWLIGLTANGESYVSNAKLPLWAFHAINDSIATYTVTQNSINGLNALNPQVKPLFTLMPDGNHYIWPRVYNIDSPAYTHGYEGIMNIYEWFLGQDKSLPVNILPIAHAGNDTTIYTSPGTATLNGSTSTDDVTIVRYVWKKITGAAADTIQTPLGAASSTTVSGLNAAGDYKYELIVVDNRSAIARDTVTIHVVNTHTNGKAVTLSSLGKIATGDVTQLDNASKFTLEAQFKYDATVSNYTTLFRKSTSLTDRIMLHIGPNNNSMYVMV
ncbi:carboxylesterase family protein, partial [Flavitalea flava]